MTENKQKQTLYKILLLGDSSVGKTCFLMRYVNNTFQDVHMSTIGLDYKLKSVQLDDGNIIKIQIWDTAGQDRFRSITKNYYKGAHGIILIYDITNKQTFQNVQNWITTIKEEVSDKVKIVLVGNKIDEEESRKVTTEEGQQMAKQYGLDFHETSAKTGINIDSTFKEISQKIFETYTKEENKGDKLVDKKTENKKKNCC